MIAWQGAVVVEAGLFGAMAGASAICAVVAALSAWEAFTRVSAYDRADARRSLVAIGLFAGFGAVLAEVLL